MRMRRRQVLLGALGAAAGSCTSLEPPPVPHLPNAQPRTAADGITRIGQSYERSRGGITEVRLSGPPAEIGDAHAKLLHGPMIRTEAALYDALDQHVPVAPLRELLVGMGRLEYHHMDRNLPFERRIEIGARARAFRPDPFVGKMPTYERFVFLEGLYDIALGFEHSPLLGCTSFVATGAATATHHTYLARNFDFEAGPIYDEGKVVFLVEETGRIPYASVAWPGFVGAVSGMNAAGVAVVVHGARARETRTEGEPVVQTTRRILAEAKSLDEALSMVEATGPLVSHMLLVADAFGNAAVVERAPGERAFVRRMAGTSLPLTNHFEGPLAADPKNQTIRKETSTLLRRERLDELLSTATPLTPEGIVGILRDKKGPKGENLDLGDRAAIDAVIAAHAVVMDTTSRTLWVSEGPHLMGRFVRFDLGALLNPQFVPTAAQPLHAIAPDPSFTDGRYQAWLAAGAKHPGLTK